MISIWMVVFFFISCSYAAENLPAYNADPSETSVSGLSSGAFFATQMQVAYSASIKGAGIVAGGPYDCAAEMSYTSCMYMSTPPITTSIANTKAWSGNRIDNIENLAKQKVYMFSGTSDTTVSLSVMNQSYNYYVTGGQFIPAENVVFKRDLRATHTFITDFDSPGNNNCQFSMSPYISNCGFDGAGAILQQIYGSLKPRNDEALSGDFLEVNQGEFLPNPTSYGMSNTAWVYVPKVCASNVQTCKLHIAFHGCLQGYEKIGDKFVKNTGFNRWADTNNIIVLYPQAVSTYTNSIDSKAPFPNLNGCWDWIGWYGDDFDVKSGKQLSTMKKMIDRITSGFNPIAAPTNVTNIGVTNSSISLSWNQVVNASGYNVYRNNDKANSDIITNTQFTDINLSSGTTYTYTVKAISLSGGESGPSKSLVANTTGPPPAILPPTGLATADITSDSIGLVWQAASGAKRYNIFRDGNKVGDTSETSYTDAGLNPATNYTYQVSSVQGSQESAKSRGITATTMSEKVCYVDNNYHHVVAGRATERGGFAFANGSEQNMGLWNIFITTTLCRIKENYYVIES